MKKNRLIIILPMIIGVILVADLVWADSVLHWVEEPRLVPSVSSKTEGAWSSCRWCGGKVRYSRTYRWDPYGREWIETTKDVPTTCRKCKSKDKSVERVCREEAVLDRKLALKGEKARVAEKRQQLRDGAVRGK